MRVNAAEPNNYNIILNTEGPKTTPPAGSAAPSIHELYDVHIYPGAGEVTTVRPSLRQRQYRPRIQTGTRIGCKTGSYNTAEGRARRVVRRFATHYGLSRTSTLRGDPTDCSLAVEFNRFLDRLNDACGQVLWLAIPEYGKRGPEHIHLLTHPSLDVKLLRRTWTSTFDSPTRRHFWSKQMNSIDDIRKHANYLTKTFGLPAESRPSRRRYRNSKHPLPKPIVFRDVTQAEIELLSEKIIDLTGSKMNMWKSDNYWYPEIRTWSPTIDTTAELENFLKLYKPL